MKPFSLVSLVAFCPLLLLGQAPAKKPSPPPHPNGPASEQIQTEEIITPGKMPAVPSNPANNTGYLEPAQLKALAHKIWLAQYRLNDLLAQVHSEKWKMTPETRKSFDQSLESLRQSIAAEEDWRSQLEARPDSLYLGFQTYMAIGAVLPRVDGVAREVSHSENASFGGQYSQAANQLFDLQQAIEPHLAYLLKNQDNALLIEQSNLASCQNELSFAEHSKDEHAIPMKNIVPEFKGRRRTAHVNVATGAEKPADVKTTGPAKPDPNPPGKPQTK